MTYWIEINIARRGAPPIWRTMVERIEDHTVSCVWQSKEEVLVAFAV